MKPLITFDMDGVLAGGPIVSKEEQDNPQVYRMMPIMCRCGIQLLKRLLEEERCYVGIVTARHFDGAETITREWLQNVGVPHLKLAFVLTHIPTARKAQTIKELDVLIHFDDRMEVARALGPQGCVEVAECAWNAEEMWDVIQHVLYEKRLIKDYQTSFISLWKEAEKNASKESSCNQDGYPCCGGVGVGGVGEGGSAAGG